MKIFCIESWSGRLDDRDSVRPLLELLEQQAGIEFFHQRVHQPDQLAYYLDWWSGVSTYQLGFLAMHGAAGEVSVANRRSGDVGVIDLIDRTTAADAGDEFALDLTGKTVYFGSCSTMGNLRAIQDFREHTGAALVCGYTKDVDWMEAAAFELLLLHRLAANRDHRRALRPLLRDQATLVRRLGFTAVPAITKPRP